MRKINGIKIMADFCSSGIWDLQNGVMIDYDEINLPDDLVKRFKDWIDYYDDKCTDRPSYLVKPDMVSKLNTKGRALAKEIKRIYSEKRIEYWAEIANSSNLSKEKIVL